MVDWEEALDSLSSDDACKRLQCLHQLQVRKVLAAGRLAASQDHTKQLIHTDRLRSPAEICGGTRDAEAAGRRAYWRGVIPAQLHSHPGAKACARASSCN